MIHWAPLPLVFLVRMAPSPSAGKWLPNFAFSESWSCHFIHCSPRLRLLDILWSSLKFHEITFHAQAIVAFLVPGIYFPLRTRGCELLHCPMFPFCVCPYLAFLVAGLTAGLVALSALSSWATCVAGAPGHLGSASWHVVIPQGRTKKHTNTPKPLSVVFTLEHQDAVIVFHLFFWSRQCWRSASLLFWVKFIFIADIASLCDMVGMCTGLSSALCSPGLPPSSPFFILFSSSYVVSFDPISWAL